MSSGLWVLAGILIFTIIEKIFSGYANADETNPQPKCVEIANCLLRKSGGKILEGQTSEKCIARLKENDDGNEDSNITNNNTCDIEDVPNGCYLREREQKLKEAPKKVAGYLNLMANSIDNFTHGLAVAGSFLVSFRHGVLATFAILRKHYDNYFMKYLILLFVLFNIFIKYMRFHMKWVILPYYFVPVSIVGMQHERNFLPLELA